MLNSPVVEIDECLFTHINGEQIWVLGIYDRAYFTKEKLVKFFYLESRNADTIEPIIQANVATDLNNPTRVYTDGWRGYNGLEDLGKQFILINYNVVLLNIKKRL